jgi:sortase A
MDYVDIPLGVECAWPVASIAMKRGVWPCGTTPRRAAPAWRAGWRRPIGTAGRRGAALSRVAFALALLIGGWHLGQAAYIVAKAQLAQVLIGKAWQRTLAGERTVKPWPWADTWPVARLEAPGHDVELFVLAGADGRTIAFGPGHVFGTANPGEAGNSVIGGHRDTHLRFLKDVRIGDRLVVERPDGRHISYRIDGARIVDKSAVEVLSQAGRDRLTLITCWPFDALRTGGPERYVVNAVRDVGS